MRPNPARNRRRIGGLATLALGLGTLLATLPATAQGACICYFSQSLIPDIQAAGRIESVHNTVLATTPQGWQAARPGQTLAIADSIQTGPDGSALVTIGAGCRIELGAQSTLNIWPVDGNYCVAVGRPAPDASGGTADSTNIFLPRGGEGCSDYRGTISLAQLD